MKYLIFAVSFFTTYSFALTVETYNIGLARGFVDHAEERRPHIIEALKKGAPDILCLQEAWAMDDRAALKEQLSKIYPHSHVPPVYQTSTSRRPSCKPWELFGEGKFVSCMQSQCGSVEGDEFTDCIINKCGESLERLKSDNRECASSLMAKVGQNPILSILKLMNPFYRSGLYAYRGSSGLAIFSKLPLKEKAVIDFSDISTLNRRQALSATIESDGEEVAIACAHLAAKLTVPYTGKSESWEKENLAQTQRLIKKTANASKAIIMGDFNCGLESSNTQAELPTSCMALSAAFKDPGAGLDQCTYCSDNALNSGKQDNFIDHIFIRGLEAESAEVVRKESIQIKTKNGVIKTNLSDHYGLRVSLD